MENLIPSEILNLITPTVGEDAGNKLKGLAAKVANTTKIQAYGKAKGAVLAEIKEDWTSTDNNGKVKKFSGWIIYYGIAKSDGSLLVVRENSISYKPTLAKSDEAQFHRNARFNNEIVSTIYGNKDWVSINEKGNMHILNRDVINLINAENSELKIEELDYFLAPLPKSVKFGINLKPLPLNNFMGGDWIIPNDNSFHAFQLPFLAPTFYVGRNPAEICTAMGMRTNNYEITKEGFYATKAHQVIDAKNSEGWSWDWVLQTSQNPDVISLLDTTMEQLELMLNVPGSKQTCDEMINSLKSSSPTIINRLTPMQIKNFNKSRFGINLEVAGITENQARS